MRMVWRVGIVVVLAGVSFVGFRGGAAPFDQAFGAARASVAPCSTTLATLTATTDHTRYLPGSPVRVTVDLHNHAARTCSYAIGPTSPSFRVLNAAGTTVWGSCWIGGTPGPCADFLLQRTVAAGATAHQRFAWDQRSGTPDELVPAGRYRFAVSLQGIGASITFTLLRPRTLSLGMADAGHRVTVLVGQRVSVTLPTSGVLQWGGVNSSDPTVLSILPVPMPLGVTMFEATNAGVAVITATGNPSCYPQCLMPSRLLRITVVVQTT